MNKLHTYPRILLSFLILVFSSAASFANHLVGMDLSYAYVSGNTYTITLTAYGDCGSAATSSAFSYLPTNTPQVYIYDGDSYITTLTMAIEAPSEGVEITPVCPADLDSTQCTNLSYTIPGIKKFVYSATYTFPGASSLWRILFTGMLDPTLAGRALTITNISSTPVTYIQLVDTLNNNTGHNTNPVLSNIPTPFFCINNSDNYNPAAVDPDGDSLTFFLVAGQNGSTTSVPYTGAMGLVTYGFGFSGTAPLSVTSMTFDPATGQIAFNPDALQRSLVVYNIEERRDGVLVGTSQREMTFLVQTCTNTPPTGSLSGATSGSITDSTHFQVCAGTGSFSVNINPTEANPINDITVTYAGLPSGATFTITGNGTPTPHATFSWTTTGVATGAYTFYVTYTDNNCPLSGTQTIAYTVTVSPQPTASYSLISSATCTQKGAISIIPGGPGGPWVVDVSESGDTLQRFTGVTSSFTDSLAPGSYVVIVYANSGHGCTASVAVTVAAPTPPVITAAFVSPTYCGADNGSLTISGLNPGTTDTIKYSFDGVVHAPYVGTASSGGAITLSPLLAGTYSAITATYDYCITAAIGPEVLANPPFTMRAFTSVNPVYCGVCNGSVTLYGLYPGQTDSISYAYDGITIAPIVTLIGADSTVTITGLCAGTYTNFVARTAGVCISNTLGPVVLTAPPFTISTVSAINPTFCNMCNGTMTIHGIYPGMFDTVNYTYNGVVQPAVPAFVGSDSTITITGLCDGVYADISVHTAGVCISNVLGPVTLTAPTINISYYSSVNPSYCGICNGTITLHGLQPSMTDTINYTYNGVAQPAIVRAIGTDSTVELTGLCVGVYNNFVAKSGALCVSNTVGPVTLVTPSFTMRTIGSVNPSYCGICNGSITLYGLYPGETDSIHYTIGGVDQTPLVRLIGSDSTVTLTGLCAGVYDSFVASTAGVCVSNVLGPATLTVPAFSMRAISFTNPAYCGICNGTITLYGLHPGETDSIYYSVDGVAQPPLVSTIGVDSTVILTGLCAGTYADFVAHAGGACVSNTLGPVTLTVPSFTVRTISSTNPDYCGICNGTIMLYGLYPGETDSIHYTLGGVAQTPYVSTVTADSTITLTGLCAGAYNNFVAQTGGSCVSNSLGPADLVVPAFTMRSLSFTNPPYCGICSGTITLYGLHPGETDSIHYTENGVAQPVYVVTIGADSMVRFTGLCAGLYDNFIATTGGDCVSNTLGPADLTVPAFTMRALSYTDPVYCGICNGSITLYGLYPGQTDTINYMIGGVAQTPVVRVIGADSTIALTGLCGGDYSNFVANTGGVCVSNALGPADLVIPPFTMRGLNYINPTECGFCNGSITLYGLYPGQLDTINYTINGIAQPPVATVIPSDSIVTLTSLCAGAYGSFVANTAGVCVSNALGPDTLVAPPIVPGFNFTVEDGCKADTIVFTNTSAPASQLQYEWYFGDSTSDTGTDPTHIYYSPGVINIKLVITNTRCYDSITESTQLTNLINAGFTEVPDSFLCQGKPVTFTNTSTGYNLQYLWNFGDGDTDNTINTTHSYTNSGVYDVELMVLNASSCTDTVIKTITVDSLSAISLDATDSVICGGNSVEFTGIYTASGNTGVIWSFGDGDSAFNQNPVTHSFPTAGTYTIYVEATYRACADTSITRQVVIFTRPNIYLGADTSICPGSPAIVLTDVDNEGNPHARWQWNTGQTTPSIDVVEPGEYWATVDIDGCSATDSVTVTSGCYMDIPNAFTPNGDGINDYFFPRIELTKGLATFKMDVYNRWGQLVFEATDLDGRGWDGRWNGVMQPEGVFVYIIDATFTDGEREHHAGNVTLLK